MVKKRVFFIGNIYQFGGRKREEIYIVQTEAIYKEEYAEKPEK